MFSRILCGPGAFCFEENSGILSLQIWIILKQYLYLFIKKQNSFNSNSELCNYPNLRELSLQFTVFGSQALGLCLCLPLLGPDTAVFSPGQDSTQGSPSPRGLAYSCPTVWAMASACRRVLQQKSTLLSISFTRFLLYFKKAFKDVTKDWFWF